MHQCRDAFLREMEMVLPGKSLENLLCVPTMQHAREDLVKVGDNIEVEKDRLLETAFKKGKVEVGRFKGLGEMTPPQLKSTTMLPESRSLARVVVTPEMRESADALVETLMGKKPELRFQFIQDNAPFVEDVDV